MSKGPVFNHDLRVERGARFSLRSPGPFSAAATASDVIAAWPLVTFDVPKAGPFPFHSLDGDVGQLNRVPHAAFPSR